MMNDDHQAGNSPPEVERLIATGLDRERGRARFCDSGVSKPYGHFSIP